MSGAKPQTSGPMRLGTGFDVQRGAQRVHHSERVQSAFPGDRRGALWPRVARVDDAFSTAGLGQQTAGSVPSGGQRAPGAGRTDGGTVGPTGGRHRDGAPRFDQEVGPGAYLWWYVDAISDDGQYALTIIAFVGSAFSPYYAHALSNRGHAVDAQNHCAINVALYGGSNRRWTMTERGLSSLERTVEHFQIGPSNLRWTGGCLEIDLNEVAVPIPWRVCGRVRVYPEALCTYSSPLDDQGKHRWGPIAPCARVEVDFAKPDLRWSGNAYLDSNEGDEPISGPFRTWDWSRARMADGSTAVIYDVMQTNGAHTLLAERFRPDGSWSSFDAAPQREKLPSTLWRIDRGTRTNTDGLLRGATSVLETLEDTPFYARSLLQTNLLGEQVTAVHETLQPQRLNRLPVRLMLPWRMPRRA